MGNSAAGRLTATYFGTAATVLGAAGGVESKTFLQANLPNVNFTTTGTINVIAGGLAAPLGVIAGQASTSAQGGGVTSPYNSGSYGAITATLSSGSTPSGGSGTPVAVASPMMLATVYLKL